jgi:hypothetical protein
MYVLKYMCESCQGSYTVASDGDHLKQLLQLHIPGPPSDQEQPTVAPFIQMGFPSKLRSSLPMYAAHITLLPSHPASYLNTHTAALCCCHQTIL